uniref:Transferrin n=1 Tax=Lethocerus distinctifemur TaxID=280095 RepID=A0A2K8JLE0_9HEMI|nr:venom transferrin 1 [Lethocerus distinctifemur]
MRATLCFLFALLAVAAAHDPFKICVPDGFMKACEKMVEQGKTVGVSMTCVSAMDRLHCIKQIKDHKADFEAVDPEDMYVAAKISDSDFSVIKEIRTKEEPTAEFRYEAVAVIHKDLKIDNLQGLKGLRSCHTGVGRNVGYKIPITKLTNMGILGPLDDPNVSPRENELKALSKFFSKACLVGKWSPHPETNQRLKAQYSNLCELCEHPDVCDYPDVNSGYDGALRCLAAAGGQVAWTKVIFVKKFFGMPYGMKPAEHSDYNPEDFAYLCPDATKRPITGPPCSWAARPWPGYMANKELASEYKELRDEIAKLNNLGETTHADWIATVLALNDKTIAVDNTPSAPLNYLTKAKYLDVIERDVIKPKQYVRICVHTELEKEKCEAFKLAAYSRDIRPSLSCFSTPSLGDCMEAVKEGKAEVMIVDAHEAVQAEESYGLKPLVTEQYDSKTKQELVAVVKKSSSIQKLEDLKGKKACLQTNGKTGYTGTIKGLLDRGLISKTHCPLEKSLDEFFSNVQQSADPIKCLQAGNGDVAFVPYYSLHKADVEVEMLCPSGRKPYGHVEDCSLGDIPPQMVMGSGKLTQLQQDDIMFSLLAAGNLYGKRPELFKMFGSFKGEPNVIFSNHATGLVAITDVEASYEQYKKIVKELSICKV